MEGSVFRFHVCAVLSTVISEHESTAPEEQREKKNHNKIVEFVLFLYSFRRIGK